MKKFIYVLSQNQNRGYDTYDSCIVVATSEEEARTINPNGDWCDYRSSWCRSPDQVKVERIGIAKPSMKTGIVLASFNAG